MSVIKDRSTSIASSVLFNSLSVPAAAGKQLLPSGVLMIPSQIYFVLFKLYCVMK